VTYQHAVREILHFSSVNRLPTPIAHELYYTDYKHPGGCSRSKLWNYIHWACEKRRLRWCGPPIGNDRNLLHSSNRTIFILSLDIREPGTILAGILKVLCGAIQAQYEDDHILEITSRLPVRCQCNQIKQLCSRSALLCVFMKTEGSTSWRQGNHLDPDGNSSTSKLPMKRWQS
jgi:hypothetical protein